VVAGERQLEAPERSRPAQPRRLTLQTRAIEGSPGSRSRTSATVHADQPDANPADDSASVAVYVQSWGARMKTGTYVGTGVANRAITGLGFKPDFVLVKGYTNKPGVVTTSAMVSVGSKELGPVTALQTGMITSLDADGFTLGASQDVNRSTTTYTYFAAEAAPGALAIGQYTGDAVSFHPVTGVGFQPDYVVVLGQGATQAVQRFGSEGVNKGSAFGPYSENGNWIKTFDVDGFSLGTSSDVNAAGGVYYYVAWNALPNVMSVGTYAGTGIDNTPVTGAGFAPEAVMLKSKQYNVALHRNGAMTGDATLKLLNGSTFSNGIQQLTGDGFVAGTDSTVNAQNTDYYWVAFKNRVTPAHADVQLTLGVDHPNPAPGDTLTYTLLVQNGGPDGATGVDVTDRLPAGLEFVSATPNQGDYDPISGIWTVGGVSVGALETMTLRARVAAFGGTSVADTATVSDADQSDPSIGNNTAIATVTVQSADLAVDVAYDLATPNVGDTLTCTVHVSNAGPNTAAGVAATNRLPAGLAFVSASATQGGWASSTGVWSVGTLAPSALATFSLRARVTGAAAGLTIADTAAVAASTSDPVAANNMAIATASVPASDLALDVTVDRATPTVADTVTWTAHVTNNGPSVATGVVVSDRAPAGLGFVSATLGQGSWSNATGLWNVGTLAIGASTTLVIRTLVPVAAAGNAYADTATMTAAAQADPVPANNSASATGDGAERRSRALARREQRHAGRRAARSPTPCRS
jgi:uncharacterized repeat protein (TIGR01451 family)